jgi:hypothetical protein
MSTVHPSQLYTTALPPRTVLSIVAPAGVTGHVGRLADQNGAAVPDVPSVFTPASAETFTVEIHEFPG